MSLDPQALADHVLTAVTSSWHELDGKRSPEPLNVWLSLEGLGTFRLHTLNGLSISAGEPDVPVEMGEHGRIVHEGGEPAALSARVGERIKRVSGLFQDPPGARVGMVLHFRDISVGVADVGDELVVAEWPAIDWSRWGVSIEHRD